MFLKHRRLALWLLCLGSALLLSLGSISFSQSGQATATTESDGIQNSSLAVTSPTRQETEPAGTEREELPSESAAWTQAQTGSEPAQRSHSPYLRAAALIGGVILGAVFLFFRQKGALISPETALGAVLWLPGALDGLSGDGLLLLWAVMTIMLTAARELLWWALNRFSLDWSLSHRLGLMSAGTERKTGYLLTQALYCAVVSVMAAAWILWNWNAGLWKIVGCAPFLLGVLLSALGMVRLGRELDHLTGQIRNLHDGKEVEIRPGAFDQRERELGSLRTQIDEAVRTAVTGERFKVELIANVSHDLRTPLTAILGYGELLEGEAMSEDGRQKLAQLNRKAGYMRDLVESLFELTKVSSGAAEARREKIDLIRLLEQTIGLFDDRLKDAGLQVKRHYCADSVPVVTDGARMHQVFANLLGNAIKYALPGTRIHLEVTEGETVTVRMTNIASYEMDFAPEEILQRFARADKARTTEGSGIGLAIAQTYTQSVGGSFHIHIDGDQFSAVTELPKTERDL